MRQWDISDANDVVLAVVRSLPEGGVSVRVLEDPLTARQADELRLAIGAAVADVRADDKPEAHDAGSRDSQRGEDHG